jgi:hypothetical protein
MDDGQGRRGFGRRLFLLRFRKLRIAQETFAERFGLTLGAIKDQEQCRHAPSRAMRVLVEAIDLDPGLIELAAKRAFAAEQESDTDIQRAA